MGKKLVIVESPGKVKKISAILGNGYTVKASVGHVRDLPEKALGVSVASFRPSYVLTSRGRDVVAGLKKAAEKADEVLLATDPDREGEAIAWHLAETLSLKRPRRITFQAITESAVRAALASPRALDLDLVQAQEARRVLDRLVGYSVSPVLSDLAGQRGLSAGRVQSPAVRLVVDRERAIQTFKPTKHFGVELSFPGSAKSSATTPAVDACAEASAWKALWDVKPHLAEGQEYFTDELLAAAVAKVRELRVVNFEDGEATEAPRPPFTTCTLQQEASSRLKLKPKATMDLAQHLYEQGAITYHRTDSSNLADEACSEIEGYARDKGLELPEKRRRWKAKQGAQEAHEAIRPTHIEVLEAGESEEEKALYRLIWIRTLASQLADAIYAVRTAKLEAISLVEEQRVSFTARGRTLRSSGWRAVYEAEAEEGSEEGSTEASNPVPELSEGQAVVAASGKVLSKTTKPPTRFKQATLIKELEKRGIGRPSTYAAILENITGRGYIAEDPKGYLSPKASGELVVDTLVGKCQFIDLEYTRQLEEQLDVIASGQARYQEVLSLAYGQLQKEVAALGRGQGPEHPCPACGKPLRKRNGKNGPFWGCSAYPECKTALPDIDGKPGKRDGSGASPAVGRGDAPQGGQHKCQKCGRVLQRRKKEAKEGARGYDFFGCTGYPECKQTYEVDRSGKPVITKKK